MKDFVKIQEELAQPFAPQDLEWRVQYATDDKTRGMVVPYVTSRAIQDRLDAVVGAENWRNEFQPWQGGKNGAQICGISIFVEERKEWITKWDGAENTNIAAVKGGLSDSMKRAAVQWGIGRVLYKMPPVWVNVTPRGNSCYIPEEERPNLDSAYMDALRRMNLIPAAAGGLQSQLGGMPDAESAPQDFNGQGRNAPGQGAVWQGSRSSRPPQNRNAQPAQAGRGPQNTQWNGTRGGGNVYPEYTVQDFKITPGMKRATTRLSLRDNNTGEELDVFLNGVDERLVINANLTRVVISTHSQGNVNYLTLDSYEVLPLSKAA